MKVSTARFSELHALDKHKEFGIATKLKPPSSRHTKYPVSSNMASEIFNQKWRFEQENKLSMGYHVFCIATFDYQQTYLN
jgi:hypothetical protein